MVQFLFMILLGLSVNAHAVKQADTSLKFSYENASGAPVEPTKAVQANICKGEKIYKITVKGNKTTRELVEAVVNEKGNVSMKAVK